MKTIHKIAAGVMAVSLIGGIIIQQAADTTAESGAVSEKSSSAAAVNISDDEYIYGVGSVSKTYVSAAVMQLADEGKIDIEAPVTEYIPDFTMADERYKDITVRMLMDHTSGIMGSVRKDCGLYADNDPAFMNTLLEHLSKERLRNAPGAYAAYCNDGFDLLALIVENVSGMEYTEYIKQNITAKTGGNATGSHADLLGNDRLVPSVNENGLPFDTEYAICLGAGGIFATASDTAKFGTGFFTGNGSILSESAKNAMGERWDGNEFHDGCGLGWDIVDIDEFAEKGVKVVGKGGDSLNDHAWLNVVPDNDISVCVLTNGGGSQYNELMAEELTKIALEEQGITIEDKARSQSEIVTEIPEEYSKYAGWYIQCIHGQDEKLWNISFPGNKYMHIEECDTRRTECTDFVLTTNGDFAELAYEVEGDDFDTRLAPGYNRISFEENEDGMFTRQSAEVYYPGLGIYKVHCYNGQKIEENNVSDEVINAYKAIEGKPLLLVSDKYSSYAYDGYGYVHLYVSDKLRGYAALHGMGMDFWFKMTDENHLTAFKNIPSSASRDVYDITLEKDENGTAHLYCSNVQDYITDENIPVFDANVKTVEIGDSPVWYDISDDIANTPVYVAKPAHGYVYVYNKFGDVIYNPHVTDASPYIPMPKGGKVLFLGEKGEIFELTA